MFITSWGILLTNDQTNKQNEQRDQKHNLLCGGKNEKKRNKNRQLYSQKTAHVHKEIIVNAMHNINAFIVDGYTIYEVVNKRINDNYNIKDP